MSTSRYVALAIEFFRHSSGIVTLKNHRRILICKLGRLTIVVV